MSFPIFFENSRFATILSKLSPGNLHAFSFGPFVWSRGPMSPRLRLHETIHWKQQLELLFFAQWALVILFYIWNITRYRSAFHAYRNSPFEREAYDNDGNPNYLSERRSYAWLYYLKGSTHDF